MKVGGGCVSNWPHWITKSWITKSLSVETIESLRVETIESLRVHEVYIFHNNTFFPSTIVRELINKSASEEAQTSI